MHLDVWDKESGRNIFLELRDFLPLMPACAHRSRWEVTAFEEWGGYPSFEVVQCERMYQLEDSHDRIEFAELADLAAEVKQVIWGSFRAFEKDADLPWLVLSAVDSTFWRVATEDEIFLAAVRKRFSDVRIGER